MQHILYPSSLKGTLQAPPSKSMAQRAIAIASLAPGTSEVIHAGQSEDVRASIRVCRELGASITENDHVLQIGGGFRQPTEPLDCGESGLSIRMFSSLAALLPAEVTLTGHGSLLKRPMDMVSDALQAIGVTCKTSKGFAPLRVTGPIPGGTVEIDGSVSSQVLTGILMAGPYALKPLEIIVNNLKSRQYIDLTMEVMKAFGVEVTNLNYKVFKVPAPMEYIPARYYVEGDWSNAALLLVAGAIAGKVTLLNLRADSLQPDRAILTVLEQCGAKVDVNAQSIGVEKNLLNAFSFDATHCPDLFPPLVALAAHCRGTSVIKGVHRLKVKESDRGKALQQEFEKMGISITFEGDSMMVRGGRVKESMVHSHNDHRIAMACAVAALAGEGPVIIRESQAVNKSYPGFFDALFGLCTE